MIILLPVFIFGSTFYVDNYAPNAGIGSINQPFNSLTQALNTLQPGDTLYLRGTNTEYGQIYFEDLDLPLSGNVKDRIIVMNYQNEVLVISINNNSNIDQNYWTFKGIIFEDLNSEFSKVKFSGTNNSFYNCIFRTNSVSLFGQAEKLNNQFKFCKIEN